MKSDIKKDIEALNQRIEDIMSRELKLIDRYLSMEGEIEQNRKEIKKIQKEIDSLRELIKSIKKDVEEVKYGPYRDESLKEQLSRKINELKLMKKKAIEKYEKGELDGDTLKKIIEDIEFKLVRQEALLEAAKKGI